VPNTSSVKEGHCICLLNIVVEASRSIQVDKICIIAVNIGGSKLLVAVLI
jgi:hypothetical protein